MDQLPSTQQIQDVPVIFLNDDGQPLHVFVEASGIIQRPRLVRTLKRAGAEICSDARQAQVILVDSRSLEGRTFIRDWGNDGNKVILEYSWVSKSIAAGKALGANEQWGNCLTQDDGLNLDPDGNFEDDVDFTNNNPLPTPRVTPVDTSIVRVDAAQKASVTMVAEPQKVTDIDTDPPFISQTREDPASASVSSFVQNNDFQYPVFGTRVPSTGTQHYAPAFPSNAQPYPANAALPFHFMQQLWAQMAMPQAVSHFNTDAFAMSLADAMRNHGMVSYQTPHSQSVPEPFPGNFPPHESIETLASGSLGNDVEIPSKSPTPPPPTPVPRRPKLKLKPPSNGPPPQVARRSARRPRSLTPPVPSTSRVPLAKKRKRKERSPEDRRKTIASFQPLHSTESPPRASEGNHSYKIFVDDKGEPMTFFVQVDQPNRFSVVTSIKKNGGKISNTQTLADYAILHTQSKTFTDLLVSTLEAGKTAVSPAFIYDCVHENSLLDPAQYKFKLGRSKKRAALHSSSSDVEELSAREHKRFNENRGRQDKKKRTPQELEGQSSRNQAVVKLEQEEVEIVLERFRVPSPTPPPAHTQQATSRGYKYPDIEREYALKYMRVLLGRDHLMSSQAMADRLYKKLPHHSLGSWRHYISGNMRDDVEKLRKKAAIAYRKAMQQKHPEVVKEEPRDGDLNGTTFDASNTNAEEERRREEEEDLDVVCNFFAYGGGDEQIVGESEDAVWTRLGSNTPCKTANSWIEFYDKHYHVIQERYETLIGTIAQSNHPEADPGRMNIDPRLN